MVAVAVLAVNFVEQIAGAVDDEVLIGEVRRGVHAAEEFDDLQTVDGAVRVVDGVQDFFRAIFRCGVAVLNGQAIAEHAGGGAGVAAGDEQVAAADAEIQITGLQLRERHAQFLRLFLGRHAESVPCHVPRRNDEFNPAPVAAFSGPAIRNAG